ncbi:MAG: hypothetical protein EOO60_13775 [Hymenobacter sp.]|nr:MAG: hypothetical protein EOO60_13775 [Hymenobacter sp.]
MNTPLPSTDPQVFTLVRHSDETGISGTGRVLDGVIFHTGQVVVCWRSDLRTDKPGHSSIVIYASWEAFRAIHIEPHPVEQTEVLFAPLSF